MKPRCSAGRRVFVAEDDRMILGAEPDERRLDVLKLARVSLSGAG